MFFRNLLIKMNYAMSVATSAFFLSPIVIAQNIDSISNAKNAVAHKSEDNLIRLMFSYNYEDPINRRLLTKLDEYSNTTEGIVIIPDKYVGFSESEPPVKQPVPQSKIKKEQKIILALESSAAEYLYSQLDTIPAETPIILAEIDKYPADFIKKHKNTAAILRPDVSAKTVRFALELFPKAKNVYVLTDISPRGDFVSNDFNRIKKDFPGANIIEIEHEKTSTHEMLTTISKTRGNDIIIFCSWLKDHDKASYTNASIISQITEVTTAPIFSPFRDIISKNGILGGECMDFENFFALVLENMQKAVNSGIFGKDEIDIPKTERAVNFPMLAKYNINLSNIPKSVTLRKVPPTFFQTYKTILLSTFVAIGFLSFGIITISIAALKIRKQRNLLNSILSQTPLNLYITNAVGKIIIAYAHDKILDATDTVGKKIDEISAPFTGMPQAIQKFLLSGEKMKTGEWSYIMPSGFKKYRSGTFLKLDASAGDKNMRFAFFTRDITQTRQLRDFIASELSMRNRILESTVNAIVVINSEGKISFINHTAAALKGSTPKAFIGKNCAVFFEAMSMPNGESPLNFCLDVFKTQKSAACDNIRISLIDASDIVIDATFAPITMVDANKNGVIVTCKNVTEIVKAKERLEYVKKFVQNAVKMMQAYYFSYDLSSRKFIPECTSEELTNENGGFESILSAIKEDDRNAISSEIDKLTKGEIQQFDKNFKTPKNGDIEYYKIHAERTKSTNNEDIIIGVIINYTQARKSQHELSETKALLENIFMYAPYGISLKDYDSGKFILWNKALIRLTGLSAEEATENPIQEIFQISREEIELSDQKTLKNGSYASDILSIRNRRDGVVRYYSYRKIALKTPDGKNMIMSIFENSTDFIKSQYERNEILENIPEAIALLDCTKKVLYTNKYAAHITGLEKEKLVGSYCNGTFCQDAHGHFCTTMEAATTGRRHSAVKTINDRVYNVISSPILDENNTVQKIVMTLTDITQAERNKNKLSAALKKANAAAIAKSAFLSTMSHEIRTPLNVIIGSAELLNIENLPPSAADCSRSIYVASVALSQIINNVLDYSKLDAGRMEILKRTTRMEGLVADMIRLFSGGAEAKGLEFISQIQSEIPPLMIDNQHIKQILMNLISNAIKFTEKGFVKLKVDFRRESENEGTLVFEVSDSGLGISPEKQKTIFKPFEREIAKNRIQGTGLGLSISLLLVRLMEGSIEFQSELGVGSKFTVSIPNIQTAKESDLKIEALPDIETGIVKFEKSKVLVVDDIAMNRTVLSKILAKLNLDTAEADGTDAAVEMLRKEKFDVVITDLWMPKKSGADLADIINSDDELKKIPVYLLTADTEMKVNFKVDKFNGIILKPISIKNISRALMSSLKTIS